MNKIEGMLLEQMQEEKFHQTVTESFDFVDSLIDHNDLCKLCKEDND